MNNKQIVALVIGATVTSWLSYYSFNKAVQLDRDFYNKYPTKATIEKYTQTIRPGIDNYLLRDEPIPADMLEARIEEIRQLNQLKEQHATIGQTQEYIKDYRMRTVNRVLCGISWLGFGAFGLFWFGKSVYHGFNNANEAFRQRRRKQEARA
ncbi:MAG: hypothetical protein V1837_00550 [Candidatus Woesearchaeota archaeon]